MNRIKYYWISYLYQITIDSPWIPDETVSEIHHPFNWLARYKSLNNVFRASLMNYREITKEEYNLYLTIEHNNK